MLAPQSVMQVSIVCIANLFSATWVPCSDLLSIGNEYHARLSAGISAALGRVKEYDTDTRDNLKQELQQSAELLDQAARLAMAAMLQVRLSAAPSVICLCCQVTIRVYIITSRQ